MRNGLIIFVLCLKLGFMVAPKPAAVDAALPALTSETGTGVVVFANNYCETGAFWDLPPTTTITVPTDSDLAIWELSQGKSIRISTGPNTTAKFTRTITCSEVER